MSKPDSFADRRNEAGVIIPKEREDLDELSDTGYSRKLDELVLEKVVGVPLSQECGDKHGNYTQMTLLPYYSSSISAAWQVHKVACGWLFSERRAYLDALTDIIRAEVKQSVAWPDVLIFLRPEHICRAALRAVGVQREAPAG
jgi:hypothetical protein